MGMRELRVMGEQNDGVSHTFSRLLGTKKIRVIPIVVFIPSSALVALVCWCRRLR